MNIRVIISWLVSWCMVFFREITSVLTQIQMPIWYNYTVKICVDSLTILSLVVAVFYTVARIKALKKAPAVDQLNLKPKKPRSKQIQNNTK